MQKNSINDEHIKKYAKAMGEVNFRIKSVAILYEHSKILPKIPEPIIIESAALQLRKVLELIAFALLVADELIYSKNSKNIDKEWHPLKIIKQMEKINHNFYPVPLVCEETNQTWIERTNNYLTKDKFAKVYKKCGDILHRCNPLKELLSNEYFQRKADFIYECSKNIINLLEIHKIQLVNESMIWVICMNGNSNGEASYHPFKPSGK